MKQYRSSDIRNFAIVGHGSSGKTSLAEAFLKLGGEINRMGTIESGSTVSDYHEGEKERQNHRKKVNLVQFRREQGCGTESQRNEDIAKRISEIPG